MRRAVFAAVLSLAGAVASGAPARGLHVEWVDVEGGAATLIVTPAGESVLVDTGWPGARDADRIKDAVKRLGLAGIDHLVVTHWHTDHVGGVADLAARLPVGRYYDHGFPAALPDLSPALREAYLKTTGGRSQVLRAGDTIPLRQAPGSAPLSLRVVTSHGLVAGEPADAAQTRACTADAKHAPIEDDKSDNHRSVGLVLSFGRFDLLDLGDLTWNVEHKLVCPQNLAGVVDVFQVTHHGASDSNNPAALEAASPTVAILNNGAKKAGKADVYHRLRKVGSLQEVFQVHRNVETTASDNAAPAFVANDEEACTGEPIRLMVDADARRYTVEVPAKGTRRTYEVK